MSRYIRLKVEQVFTKGDACATCPHEFRRHDEHEFECKLLEQDMTLEDCPGLTDQDREGALHG